MNLKTLKGSIKRMNSFKKIMTLKIQYIVQILYPCIYEAFRNNIIAVSAQMLIPDATYYQSQIDNFVSGRD